MHAEILVPPPPHVGEVKGEHEATFQVDGLYPGYGVTLGTALRRVLLSSLPGAAVTLVKIQGIEHEFSTIPGMQEDVITLLLRLKQLRFRLTQLEPQTVRLRAKGEREVYARDLQTPTGVDVVNPDFLVATLTKKSASLEMELQVEAGVGYVPREKRNPEKMEVGTIALDAIFTPVRKVTMEVEDMRVGTETNYNRLRMTIETDGSITPQAAWQQAIAILQQQFAALGEQETEESITRARELFTHPFTFTPKERSSIPTLSVEEYLKMRIGDMGLNSRTVHVLESAGIKTVGGLVRKSGEDLRSLDGIGDKALQEIRRLLGTMGLSLKVD
jgi:DNA-directed RNA polymerase subunit alpha